MKREIVMIGLTVVLSASLLCGCTKAEENHSSVIAEQIPTEDNEKKESVTEESKETATEVTAKISLDDELRDLEAKQAAHDAELSDDATQTEMNIHSAESLKLWDDELNSLWARFRDAADEDFKNRVLQEQREWITLKEEKSKEAGAAAEGGSIQPLLENTAAQEYTRVRCYELAAYLAQATDEEFTLAIPEVQSNDLHFADCQGTQEIYSDLVITESMVCYDISISLYRLATLEGKAYEKNGNVYNYVDNDYAIEGFIRVEEDSASFEITKSDFDGISVGDVFVFSERI